MKLSIAAITLSLYGYLATTVSAGFTHIVIYNDNEAVEGKSCTPSQWAVIGDTVQAAGAGRRLGTMESSSSNAKGVDRKLKGHVERELTDCTNCGSYCWAMGCPSSMGGMRRRTAEETFVDKRSIANKKSSRSGQRRELYATATACEAKIPAVELALDGLLAASEPGPCKDLMALERSVTCMEPAVECNVAFVSLVNATTQEVILDDLPHANYSFCKSTRISFKANTDFFLGKVNFVLRGPKGYLANRTADVEPYYMFGNVGGIFDGKKLFHNGTYTLSVKSVYVPDNVKTFQFKANDC